MLLEIPVTLVLTVTATALSFPGAARLVGMTQGDGTPHQPGVIGPVLGIMALLMVTTLVDPEALEAPDTRSGTLFWAPIVLAWGAYLTAGAAGGIDQRGPMWMLFAGLALLLGAITLRFGGRCAVSFVRGRG